MVPELSGAGSQLLQLSEVLLAELVNAHPVDMLDYLFLDVSRLEGSSRASVFLAVISVSGYLRFEGALIHLLVVGLETLAEVLEALSPLEVPLQLPLIGRALLTLVGPLLLVLVA